MTDWIPCSERLPESFQKVVARFRNSHGHHRRIMAEYVPAYTRESEGDDFELECNYSEELDEFFWPEGWYEVNECHDEISHVYVSEEITHWAPLLEIDDD